MNHGLLLADLSVGSFGRGTVEIPDENGRDSQLMDAQRLTHAPPGRGRLAREGSESIPLLVAHCINGYDWMLGVILVDAVSLRLVVVSSNHGTDWTFQDPGCMLAKGVEILNSERASSGSAVRSSAPGSFVQAGPDEVRDRIGAAEV